MFYKFPMVIDSLECSGMERFMSQKMWEHLLSPSQYFQNVFSLTVFMYLFLCTFYGKIKMEIILKMCIKKMYFYFY